jgi:hypothetical protein
MGLDVPFSRYTSDISSGSTPHIVELTSETDSQSPRPEYFTAGFSGLTSIPTWAQFVLPKGGIIRTCQWYGQLVEVGQWVGAEVRSHVHDLTSNSMPQVSQLNESWGTSWGYETPYYKHWLNREELWDSIPNLQGRLIYCCNERRRYPYCLIMRGESKFFSLMEPWIKR